MWGHKGQKPVNQDAGSPHTWDLLAPWHWTSQPPEMEKYISFVRSFPIYDTLWKLPKQTKTGAKQTELEQMTQLAETQWPHAHGEAARSQGICGGGSLDSLFFALQQFMPSYFLPVRTAQAFIHILGSSSHLAQSLALHEKPVVRGEIANP